MKDMKDTKDINRRICRRRRWLLQERRARAIRRSRIPVIVLGLCAVTSIGGFVYAQDGKGADMPVVNRAHASELLRTETVQVHSGDTVWGIAERYNDGSRDTRELVQQICTFNHIEPGKLQAGQILRVPLNEA